MRCCARCKTPGFGCANGACPCHNLLRAAQARVSTLTIPSPLIDGEILIPNPEDSDA